MSLFSRAPLVALGLLLGAADPSAAAADAVTQLTLATTVQSRTSLRVTSQVLVFEVGSDEGAATASIGYSAGARTRSDGEVVLVAEPLAIAGPGGAADVEATILLPDGRPIDSPSVVARWTGGGLRQGTITFTLRAQAPGTYIVPVRLVLTAP